MAKSERIEKGLAHIITVGTTPAGATDDVVDALLKDLAGCAARQAVVLATEDSVPNAERLLKGLGLKAPAGRVRVLHSAQSLEEAYIATNEEIGGLLAKGVEPGNIILHYTAGTKVMSAGAVLAAVNNDVSSLRYLYSQGPKRESIPVITPTSSVLGDKAIRLAATLAAELRFRSAREVLARLDHSLLTESQLVTRRALQSIAAAYEDWDRFRISEFLDSYRAIDEALGKSEDLRRFRLKKSHQEALEKIAASTRREGEFPDELLIDLINNAIRRLAERRPDDALIRLHRAAELYAQGILKSEFNIRTDDVEIRRVPPRHRTYFEAERRMVDAKIKIGLRKSYELLEVLGHPIGDAYRQHETFQAVLDKRRDLVLAHGVRPATLRLAMDFFRETVDLLRLRIGDIEKRAAAQQFPWIDNSTVLVRLEKSPEADDSVLVEADGEGKQKTGGRRGPRRGTKQR